ncbi:hypothetical protein CcCBS67573_g09345 [Chytriomyces confervae]|uniref:Uncharacterized protein n=1 Tax=Chytriomyces confervae TaxID=246404 RepID=A0A507DZ93_9FUNG|nr:hypothetical protein CcCBS67573_g09345 [Chytriomyces confervae]
MNCADPSCEALSPERLLDHSVGARNAASNTRMNNSVGDSTGIPGSAIQERNSFGGNGFGAEGVNSRKRSNTAQNSAGTTDKDAGILRTQPWSSITLSTDTSHKDTLLADAQYTDRLDKGKVQVGLVTGRGDRNLWLSLPTKVGMDRTLERDWAVTESESYEGGVSDGKHSDVVGGKRDLSAPKSSSSTRTLRTDWLHTATADNNSMGSIDSLIPTQQPAYPAPQLSPPSPSVSNNSGSASARPTSNEPQEQPASQETFYGFIKDAMDALLVIEACLKGLLNPFKSGSDASGQLAIRSGTVIVFAESSTQMKRWRDGERWSPSRAHGPFLLYREVESVRTTTDARDAATAFAVIPGLDPSFSTKTLKPCTRWVQDGLNKKTITLIGSDGQRHRVISYYNRNDVLHLYPDAVPETPSAFFGEGPSNPPDSSVQQDSFKNLTTPSLTPSLKSILDAGDIDFKQLLAQSITSDNFGRPKQPVAIASTSKSGGTSMRSSITADNIEAGKRLRSGIVKSYAENDEEDDDDDEDFETPVTQVSHRRTRSSASAGGAIDRIKEAVSVHANASNGKEEAYAPHILNLLSVQSCVPENRNSHVAPFVGESKREIISSEHQPVHIKVESFARYQHQALPQGQPRFQSTSVRHEPLPQTKYELLHQTSNSGATTSIPRIPFEQYRPTHILHPQQPHLPVNHLPPISEATRQVPKNFHQSLPLLLPPPTGAQNLSPWQPFSRMNVPSEQSHVGALPPFRTLQAPLQNRPYISPTGEGAKPGIPPSNQLPPPQQHRLHSSGYSQAPYLPPPINQPRQQPYPSGFEYTNRWNQQQ